MHLGTPRRGNGGGTSGFGSDLAGREMSEIRCHAPSGPEGRRCDAPIAETSNKLRIIGVFNRWESGEGMRPNGRLVKECPKCGWFNLFEIVEEDG